MAYFDVKSTDNMTALNHEITCKRPKDPEDRSSSDSVIFNKIVV
jgi:hypothetical protein